MTVTHTISKTQARVGETITLSTSTIQEPAYGVMWIINYTTSDNQKSFATLRMQGRYFASYTNPLSKSITIDQSHLEIKTLTPICWSIPEVNAELMGIAQGNPIENNEYVEIGETYKVTFYASLAESIYSLGEKLATNISEKGVSASADDGLTTLANKIDDIYKNIPRVIIEDDTVTDFADLRFTFIVPKNCTSIKNRCFADCENLKYCILPEGITRFYDDAFIRCHNLVELEIPSTVTYLATGSLDFLPSLETLRFKSVIPPTVQSEYNFRDIPTTCVIEVPCGALSAYKSATNYPDPTVYTYQCIRFDEKCDSSNGLSNFESPILLGFDWQGTSTMNYNSNMNAYALSGYFDDTVFPITQLDGQENFMMSCEINISNFGGEKIGFAIIPPETGEETTSNKYGNIVYIGAPSNNQITLQCMSKKQGGTVQNKKDNLTINIENLDWIKLCFMSDTTSSGSIIGQVEKLDGTILGTQTFTRIYSSSSYPQISNRKCGIYFLGNNEDDTVNIYIRNIKCIGY